MIPLALGGALVSEALNLLRQLGSGVRPTDASVKSAANATAGSDSAFASLLEQARSGELSSHKLVKIGVDAEDAGVKLTDEQLARLTLAADQAEAQGIRKALVIFDDTQIVLDVSSRTVIGAANITPAQAQSNGGSGPPAAGLVADIDGVLNLSSKFAPASADTALGVPPANIGALNQSITRLLEKLETPAA